WVRALPARQRGLGRGPPWNGERAGDPARARARGGAGTGTGGGRLRLTLSRFHSCTRGRPFPGGAERSAPPSYSAADSAPPDRWPLIPPALFSRPSTRPAGEKREKIGSTCLKPLSPRLGWVEGWERGVGE